MFFQKCISFFQHARLHLSAFCSFVAHHVMHFRRKHPYWFVFLLSATLGGLLLIPSIISHHGVFTFVFDYNVQQIPFNVAMNRAFQSGGSSWNWFNDLGSSYIGSYGLYNLFSPFVIILWFVPATWIPYLMGFVFILKYAVAGLTAYLFLSRHVKQSKWAIVGCLLYAFSGFQLTNTLFYHFHDVVAFFPLLLYGLDRLALDHKKGIFLLAVALNLITNYYFFIGQVVFVILYYVVMLATKQYQWSWKTLGLIALESILGVAIGCFLFIPNILYVTGNPRVGQGWTLSSALRYNPGAYAEIFRSFIFPSESMTFRSMISSSNFSSVEAYLPFVGAVLWLAYLIKKPKSWPSILMFICILFMLIPILNNSFFAFTSTYYARWFYMPTLVMALLSAKALDEHLNVVPGIIATLAVAVLVAICLLLQFHNTSFVYRGAILLVILSFMLVNIIALYCIMRHNRHIFSWLMLGIFTYITIYGNFFFYLHHHFLPSDHTFYSNFLVNATDLQALDQTSRYNSDDCSYNVGLFQSRMFVNSWNSNDESSAFQFYQSVNVTRDVATRTPLADRNLQTFLSVRGAVSCQAEPRDDLESLYSAPVQHDSITVYENPNYHPIGQDYSYYILAEDFSQLSDEAKTFVLNYALVLTEDQVAQFADLLEPYKVPAKLPLVATPSSQLTDNTFTPNSYGFTSELTASKDRVILYTVPYSAGWTAIIDDSPAEIVAVDSGFMAIRVPAGQHHIVFTYQAPGQTVGYVVSGVGLIGCVAYFILSKKGILS